MTLYAVTARFRPDAEDQRLALSGDFGEHMRQPLLHIRLIGLLKAPSGERAGMLMLMEAEDRAILDNFLMNSPYHRAGLYQSIQVDEIIIEAGGLT